MRTSQYMQGRREALKWAITFVHASAERMNDSSAMAALNVVASDMGNATRQGRLPRIWRKNVCMYLAATPERVKLKREIHAYQRIVFWYRLLAVALFVATVFGWWPKH